jgi:hypothetical protein
MFPCADHVYVRSNGNLISEPYNVSMTDMRDLISFCEENGLEFSISGDAIHHPSCIRIEIKPKED